LSGEGGYVVEFVRTVWQPLLKVFNSQLSGKNQKKVSSIRQHMQEIVKRKIKIVTNAGGMNPEGCRAAMERIAKVETG
jgi:hypothetical protein